MAGDRRGDEARRLQAEQTGADPERRVAELVGEEQRQEDQQRALGDGAEGRADRQHGHGAVFHQRAEPAQHAHQPVFVAAGEMFVARLRPHEVEQQHDRHDDAGDDVEHHHVAPAQHRQHGAGDQRRHRIADIAGHAVKRHDQAAPVRVAVAEQRDGGRVPEIIADADQRRAAEQHPIGVADAHQR